jgi:hypothetical protein
MANYKYVAPPELRSLACLVLAVLCQRAADSLPDKRKFFSSPGLLFEVTSDMGRAKEEKGKPQGSSASGTLQPFEVLLDLGFIPEVGQGL